MISEEAHTSEELIRPTETIEGELAASDPVALEPAPDARVSIGDRSAEDLARQRSYLLYFVLPAIFLTVTLLGGMRLSGVDSSFVFLKPALIYLIFATLLLLIFFKAGLIQLEGWFSEEFTALKNAANAAVLLTLFAASTQLFNSLTPEQGLPFWVIAFCFLWTLWNNLFADFDPRKLLRSLGGLFGFAFAAKYLLLANLTAPAGQGWLRSMIENPAQQTMTWLLDLPQFSAGTGYIQFFVVGLYLLGLYLFPARAGRPTGS